MKMPCNTLAERVRYPFLANDWHNNIRQLRDESLDNANFKIDQMTNVELLEAMSAALEEMLREKFDPL